MREICRPDCPERSPTCHITCYHYKRAKKLLEQENAAKNKILEVEHGLNWQRTASIARAEKIRRRRKQK